MSYKQNLHIHTTYADGKDTPEELIQEAIRRGFDSIGFSEHSYMAFSDYPYQMTVAEMADYVAEVRALKAKHKGAIDIFCGLEYEFFSDFDTEDFDYLIGSVHYLDLDGRILGFDRSLPEVQAYVQNHFGGDGIAFAKKYYEQLSHLPERKKVDIIGHFDILTKTNELGQTIDTTSREYLNAGFDAIHAMKGKIPLFEVNTGAVARGYRTAPYPQIDFMREFCRCGYGAVITSDCHDKTYLDSFYEEARQMLREAGYKSQCILTDHGFEEVAL